MASATSNYPAATLIDTLDPARNERWLRNVTMAIVGSALLAVSSKIQIPLPAVPLTLQTLVLLTMSMAFGWRLAVATVVLYLVEGSFGLPVFAGTPEKGIGLAYMFGPTGGYLVGFVIAAAVVGYLAERGWDRRFSTTALAMLIGNIVIYVPGLLWLGTLLGWDKPILQWGLTPFVTGDIIKLIVAALILPAAWKLARRGR